tara:strand:- start:111 stop:248 length:138 start_codon:yes stop_codon:yes gene_type:complete
MNKFFNKKMVTEEMIDAISSAESVEVITEEDLTKEYESDIDWEAL